jgi:hypothetical protein
MTPKYSEKPPNKGSKISCHTNGKKKRPNVSEEPQMIQKSLQTTRKKEGSRCTDRENSPRSEFRAPTVQMFVSLPHQKKKRKKN